jgi:hypothetical protein
MGLASFTWSVTGIELILYWNKMSSVYSINSTGQYIALTIGVGGLIKLIYDVLKHQLVSNPLSMRYLPSKSSEY